MRSVPTLVITALVFGSVTLLTGETRSKVASNPAFEKMKTLIGSWEGSANEGGKKTPTNARFKLMSDGSMLAGW